MMIFGVLGVALLPSLVWSFPQTSSASSRTRGPYKRCGPVSQFYDPKQSDWDAYHTMEFLNGWINNHTAAIANNSGGFAGAFGQWALGNPGWTCMDNGASDDCDLDPCDSGVLNLKGPVLRQSYYSLLAIRNLHTYFMGLSQSFEVSAIAAALSKDDWATTFYKDKDDQQVTVLREIFNGISTVIGIGAVLAGLAGPIAGALVSTAGALFSGAVGAALPLIGQHQDDTFDKAADLGSILGQIVVGSLQGFTAANNILMHGQNYENTGDMRTYISNGTFLDYIGVDKDAVINSMNGFLVGNAINELYRAQKVFIMGGGACGDNQGIGSGPQNSSVCRDGKAWYLYYWQEDQSASIFSARRWGWVALPPGADKLGQGEYAGVTMQDVINSSLDAYIAAGYAYTAAVATQRVQSALQNQWRNPGAQGPSWEGTFTIPVCDVGWAVDGELERKTWLLQEYGEDSRPNWCGAICDNDLNLTQSFISAANMVNFQSPKHLCDDDPGY